jgi:Cid1 family poly A polymerase
MLFSSSTLRLFTATDFRFAYQFDYNRHVISVRNGGNLPKEEKGWHLMQNNSLCVEEPFNTKRNLGNTADEATIKGLQLEFRRAVHYLADHVALDLACWPYAFPTSENPRPERHLPILPPHCRQLNSWKKSSYSPRYTKPQNSGSPPFKSPKPRDEDPSAFMNQRNFSSFAGSRQHTYPFNPLTLNPPLPPPQHMPNTVPNTPASSTMSSAMSPATAGGDIHHAFPPTPVDQLHYIDPFKNRQVAYYIPAFAPNGLPVYVPYSEDHLVYASPPQTPAMSETSLSHQPQYPRTHPYGFPPPFPTSRNQSVQRGRLPRRPEDGNVSPSTAFPGDHPPLGIITTTTSTSRTSSPPPYLPPMKRRNSLPPNNKPNVAHVVKTVPKPEEYISSPSSVSQSLGASVSSMGAPTDSDGFAADLDRRTSESEESADATDSTEVRTPRQLPIQTQTNGTMGKSDPTRSPSVAKESPILPAGRSYAAALLNTAPPAGQQPAMKSPTLTNSAKATPIVAVTPTIPVTPTTTTEKDPKRNKMNGTKTPVPVPTSSSSETSPQSSKKSDRESSTPASSPLSSPIDSSKRHPSVWTQPPVQPAPFLAPAEPIVPVRRPSVQSTAPNVASPKKPNRTTNGLGRKSSVITIPEPSTDGTPTPTTGKRQRKKKNLLAKKQNVGDTNLNGVSNHRRQSVVAQH